MPRATAPRMPRSQRRRASHGADDAGLLSLLCRFDLAKCPLIHPAREEDAVQVVELVLHRPREQTAALDADLLAMTVQPFGDNALSPGHLADPPGHRQASLVPGLVAIGAHHL